MHKMVFGVFKDVNRANAALADLKRNGIKEDDISVIVQDALVREQIISHSTTTADNVVAGGTSGAVAGAAIGGLTGLLIGIGAITIPGLGALLVAGPIATALGLSGAAAATASGAVTGAVAGGLMGALVGLGVPEEKARMYEEQIKAGKILLAVTADTEAERKIAEDILQHHGAVEINYYTVT